MTRNTGSGIFNRSKEPEVRPSNGKIPEDHRPRTCADCTMLEYCPKGKKRARRKMNPSKDLCRTAAKNLQKAVAAVASSTAC